MQTRSHHSKCIALGANSFWPPHRWILLLLVLPVVIVETPVQAQSQGARKGTKSAERNDAQQPANHLRDETSPYLQLHVHNPVDWYPWGPEALEKARRENKPIFLSIGYSSCFWCHVMERKVFSNEEIAAEMNEHFVNIKVDREERPDLDDIYMLGLQVYLQLAGSSQGGGWPLSLFLTPEGQPIAGGTYFPPENEPGRPGFPTVLRQIHQAWTTREEDVRRTAELVSREVRRLSQPAPLSSAGTSGPQLVAAAVRAVAADYDPEFGGFDFDPAHPERAKFPSPCRLRLMQAQIGQKVPLGENGPDVAEMVDLTLDMMAAGGIRDHLGGGFHRYSTDRQWKVPHFEKMLYDNAQLAEIYANAYRRTGREQYRQIAEGTIAFVLRELKSPDGAFYAALDAETDGVEGQYYIWSRDELAAILTNSELRLFVPVYGLDQPASIDGSHVLFRHRPVDKVAEQAGISVSESQARLDEMRQKLLQARSRRQPLLKDDKIITSWNGLMIRALAQAGQIFKRRDYIEAAENAALFLLSAHLDQQGHLRHSSCQSQPGGPAFLDDYAFFVSALLALHEATGEDKWLSAARRLTDDQIARFHDPQQGAFFFQGNQRDVVLTRLKTGYDGVLPSGNSISARNLIRLARLRTDESYRAKAKEVLEVFSGPLAETPGSLPEMALALQEYLHWFGSPAKEAAGHDLFTQSLSGPVEMPSPKAASSAPAVPKDNQNGRQPEPKTIVHFQAAVGNPAGQQHVSALGYLSRDRLTAGTACQLALVVTIAPGWHVNANPAQPDYVIPVALKLESTNGVSLKSVTYPPGEDFQVAGMDEAVSVYEGQVVIRAWLSAPEELAGDSVPLKLTLQYQACNAQNCLRPMQLTLHGDIPLEQPGESAESVNTSFFTGGSDSRGELQK